MYSKIIIWFNSFNKTAIHINASTNISLGNSSPPSTPSLPCSSSTPSDTLHLLSPPRNSSHKLVSSNLLFSYFIFQLFLGLNLIKKGLAYSNSYSKKVFLIGYDSPWKHDHFFQSKLIKFQLYDLRCQTESKDIWWDLWWKNPVWCSSAHLHPLQCRFQWTTNFS